MSFILKYLCLGLDYLLSFILLGLGAVGSVLPRLPVNPVIPDTPAFALAAKMGLGWNLGNSLDSTHTDEDGSMATGLATEIMWGNPYTTREVFVTLYEKGFRTVKLPTAWHNHMDAEGTIDAAWMARVRELVDWAYDLGFYVVLDAHSHGDPANPYIPTREAEAASAAWLRSTWAQIAEAFQDYGERLLFQAINKPRVAGSYMEWKGGLLSERHVTNRLNAVFVETVRAAGGYNDRRWLLVPTYIASPDPVAMRSMRVPDDERVIVALSAIAPWQFTDGTAEFQHIKAYDEAFRQELARMMENIYRAFIAKGVPVWLEQFGAADKDNAADRAAYAAHYVTLAAKYGMACAWWDNGNTRAQEYSGNSFALLNRADCAWYFEEIADAMAAAAMAAWG